MKLNLEIIEEHLRALFEDSLYKLMNNPQEPFNLIEQLSATIQANLVETNKGIAYAPDRYEFLIPDGQMPDWHARQDLLDQIVSELQSLGRSHDVNFLTPPEIHLAALPEGQTTVLIRAAYSAPVADLTDTAAMEQPQPTIPLPAIPANAFLVVGGRSNFPLEKPLINIGRHSDNDLVLDDPHVSRHHAQLRAINKRYVVFDVGSTSGILLNGKTITQATLRPGDVLRMGLVNLIYIQDTTSEQPTSAFYVDSDDPPFGDEHP
jgi:hypothetical protein